MSNEELRELELQELSTIKWRVAIKGEPFFLDEFRTKKYAEKYIASCKAEDKLYNKKVEYEIRLWCVSL
jgi:hypothetical protein